MNIIDRNYNLEYVNLGWENDYGPLNDQKCYEYFNGLDKPCEDCEMHEVLVTKKMKVYERVLDPERGRILQITTIPFEDENNEWAIAQLSIDISERKRFEEELKKAIETAQSATQAKSEFLANMSHEIGAPINAIKGMTELVLDSELNEEQREYLSLAKESTESLMTVINDILDFSKIEVGKLDIENIPFDVFRTISSTISTMSFKTNEKGLNLNLHMDDEIPKNLVGDPMRLRQVLVNLLSNAVKFTEKGSISVNVGIEQKFKDEKKIQLHFTVKDTGIGIPKKKIGKIFESFSQADSSITRKFGGTGLGLTISSKLVNLMGGKIWVESKEGKGSTFHFTTECLVAESRNGATSHGREAFRDGYVQIENGIQGDTKEIEEKSYNVLLVEDHLINQKLAVTLLEKRNNKVIVANNGLEAVNILKDFDFDVVLMDIQMPEMDGFEATKVIRDKKSPVKRHDIPIIAMTAHAMSGDREKCINSGMNGYISKPINVKELFNEISRIVVNQAREAKV